MEFKKAFPLPIEIIASHNNGYAINVGCVRLVYTDANDLLADLAEYLRDPEKAREDYTSCLSSFQGI